MERTICYIVRSRSHMDIEILTDALHIDAIRDEADYNGLRVSLDGIRTPLKIDITAGDKITPREILYRFNLMFEDRQIDIFAYNLETVLAEKLETVISRGITNTRMRDFYYLYC